jgi:hypothetical protein
VEIAHLRAALADIQQAKAMAKLTNAAHVVSGFLSDLELVRRICLCLILFLCVFSSVDLISYCDMFPLYISWYFCFLLSVRWMQLHQKIYILWILHLFSIF